MKILSAFVLTTLLFGAASLFAEPETESDVPMGLSTEFEASKGQVEALVRAMAEKSRWQVRVEATFLRIAAESAGDILGEHRPGPSGSARVIPSGLARQLLSSVQGQGAVRPEPLPPLVLYADQTGRLDAGGRHSYLQDYEALSSHSHDFGDPIVGEIHDGSHLQVTPHREGKDVALDVEACWAHVVRPIPRHETEPDSSNVKVTIELPEIRMFHVRDRVRVSLESGYVLAGGGLPWDGMTLRLVVMRVTRGSP